MARLSKRDIQKHRSELCVWQSPDKMKRHAEDLRDELGSVNFFNQAGLEFIRDAWSAGAFGIARGISEVRLIEGAWPDFEIRNEGSLEEFELVEADLPERRRGDEYKESAARSIPGEPLIEEYPVEQWIADAEQAPFAIKRAAVKKAKKCYSKGAHLLIYLNISEFGIRQSEIEKSFSEATAPAKDAFQSVWILWKERAYMAY